MTKMAIDTYIKAYLYVRNWTINDARIGPTMAPIPKAPVWIDATLDYRRARRSLGSSTPLTFEYSCSSVWNMAGTLLFYINAPPMPPRPIPIINISILLLQTKTRLKAIIQVLTRAKRALDLILTCKLRRITSLRIESCHISFHLFHL